ncbi:hypothetical protein FRC09_004361, partial [Ceratobasidium sp. 395]
GMVTDARWRGLRATVLRRPLSTYLEFNEQGGSTFAGAHSIFSTTAPNPQVYYPTNREQHEPPEESSAYIPAPVFSTPGELYGAVTGLANLCFQPLPTDNTNTHMAYSEATSSSTVFTLEQ